MYYYYLPDAIMRQFIETLNIQINLYIAIFKCVNKITCIHIFNPIKEVIYCLNILKIFSL